MRIIGDGMADFTIHIFTEIHGEIMGIIEIILTDAEMQIMLMAEEMLMVSSEIIL